MTRDAFLSPIGRCLLILASILALMIPGTARARCSITIGDLSSVTWTGGQGRGYDVYDPQRRTQVVTFRVRSHDGGCAFYVAASVASAQGDGTGYLLGPGGLLRYGVYKDASSGDALRPSGIATESDILRGVVAAGGSSAFQVVVALPPEQLVAPGSYGGEVEFSLYEGEYGNGILRDQRRASVVAQVPAVAELSFAEGGFDTHFNSVSVNFGALREGDRRVVHLRIRSNGGHRLLLQSVNGGALKHVDPRDDSRVPYTLKVDGAPVGLESSGEVQIVTSTDVLSSAGRMYTLEFLVESIDGASAGDYRDVINVIILSLR